MPTPCINTTDYLFTGIGSGIDWTTELDSLLFVDSGGDIATDSNIDYFSGSGDFDDSADAGSSYFTGSGQESDWNGAVYSEYFTGSGYDIYSDWNELYNLLFTGDGSTTDYCYGGRTITSFRGTLTVDVTTSVNYSVNVSPHHYKVVVIQPPRYLQP